MPKLVIRENDFWLGANMPTVRWRPRSAAYRYHYKCLERYFINKQMEELGASVLAQVLVIERNRRRGVEDYDTSHRSRMLCMIASVLCIASLQKEMNRNSITSYYPSRGMQTWTEQAFVTDFRFRREHFYFILDVMKLSGKSE